MKTTLVVACFALSLFSAHAADPLPSWNDGAAKQSIVALVAKVSTQGSPDFVPAPERIAVFDNDGCLWAEQPMYVYPTYASIATRRPSRKLVWAATTMVIAR